MSDEPTTIDWNLHMTRGHTPMKDWEKRNSLDHYFSAHADEWLVRVAPMFREEVTRLRVLLNGIVDIALKQTLLNDDNPPMVNILNIAYEGVVE